MTGVWRVHHSRLEPSQIIARTVYVTDGFSLASGRSKITTIRNIPSWANVESLHITLKSFNQSGSVSDVLQLEVER